MRNICCVHQGYELYGSDRTFLSCVAFLKERYPEARLTVILPKTGDLSQSFRQLGIEPEIQDIWVLRKSYGVVGLVVRSVLFPLYFFRAARKMRSCDLIYINTGVIVDYMLAARFYSARCVIHVHEIPAPRTRAMFRFLIGFSRCRVLFNSAATRDALSLDRRTPQAVVHNGVDIEPAACESVGKLRDGHIHVLLIGRINAWKGQDCLVEAVARLPVAVRARLRVRIVGDVFEGAEFRDNLLRRIDGLALHDIVSVEGFQPDTGPLYEWSDVVVVPSRKPEPFGLVAIEAMAHGKPVIAARHGGLMEIVVPDVTGWLHEAGDVGDLARTLERAVSEKASLPSLGQGGRARFEERFTLRAFRTSFLDAIAARQQ